MTEERRQVQGNWVVTWVNPQKPINKLDETGNTTQRKKKTESSAESERKESEHRQSVIDQVLSVLDQSPNRRRKRSVVVLYQRGKVRREEESEEEQRPGIGVQGPPAEEPEEKPVAEIHKTTLEATMEGAPGPGAMSCKTRGAVQKRTPRRRRGQRKSQVD